MVSLVVWKRLKFDEAKTADVMAGISDLTGMEDPLFQTQFARELDEGLGAETCHLSHRCHRCDF